MNTEKDIINQRFLDAINSILNSKEYGNKTEIAGLLGISASKFSEILNGRMKAGADLLSKLSMHCGISSEWILTGKKPILTKDIPYKYQSNLSPTINSTVDYNEANSFRPTPYYNSPISAGDTGILNDWKTQIPAGYIHLDTFKDCEAAFPVIGLSMEPCIHNGDIIGIQQMNIKTKKWEYLETGKEYLIITQQGRMIKILEDASGKQHILCSSPNYNKFKIYKADILEIYRIKAVIRGL